MTNRNAASSESSDSQTAAEHPPRLRLYLSLSTILAPLISGVGGYLLLPENILPQQVASYIVQTVVITIGTILPISMYYHFVQTRHPIILREFKNNLKRLGMRYGDFADRFDAVYGGGKKLGRTNAPIILATLILFVGWWMVFYPTPATTLQQGDIAQPEATAQPEETTSPEATVSPPETAPTEATASPQETAPPEETVASDEAFSPDLLLVKPRLTPLAFGFLGVYAMIIGSLARRYLTDDLKPKAFVTVIWDVLLVWAIIWTLSQLPKPFDFSSQWAPPLYFFLGLLPEVGLDLLKAGVLAMLKILPRYRNEYPLNRIQGLDWWNGRRLREEGIENIQHLATADIVDLLLRTRFPPERIVDWIDQALLQFHMKPEKKTTGREVEKGDKKADARKEAEAGEKTPSPSPPVDTPAVPAGQLASALPTLGALGLPGGWRDAYVEAAGLDLSNPLDLFLRAHIRTATDLLQVCDSIEPEDPGHKAFEQLVSPTFGLDFLITTLRHDPNIVHIRHWREKEGLAIAETAQKTLTRAKEILKDAERSRSDTGRREAYERATNKFSESLKLFNASEDYIEAMMGYATASHKLAGLTEREAQKENLKEALKFYDQVEELDKDGIRLWDARRERARLMIEHQGWDAGLETTGDVYDDLQKLLEMKEHQTTENYLLYYEILQGTVDFTGMREALTEALKRVPEDDTAKRAEILLLRAPLTGSDADYRKALEIDPGNPKAYEQLGEFYMQAERFDQASELYSQWTDKLEDSSEWKGFAYYKLGEAYRAQGEYEKAIETYEKSQHCPFDIGIFQGVEALAPLTECYKALGQYDGLIKLAKRTGNAVELARAYRLAGQIDQARKQLRTAYEIRIDDWSFDEKEYRLEKAMVEACSRNDEKATEELIGVLLRQRFQDIRALMERVERELETNETTKDWVSKGKTGFTKIEDALREGLNLLQEEELGKAYRFLTRAAKTLVQECPPAIQKHYDRISPRNGAEYYRRLAGKGTAQAVDPWVLFGLTRARTEAYSIRGRIVDGLSAISEYSLIDEITLELHLDPEQLAYGDDDWDANTYILTYVRAVAEVHGFQAIAGAGWDSSSNTITVSLLEDAAWEDGFPQLAEELMMALEAFVAGETWSHTDLVADSLEDEKQDLDLVVEVEEAEGTETESDTESFLDFLATITSADRLERYPDVIAALKKILVGEAEQEIVRLEQQIEELQEQLVKTATTGAKDSETEPLALPSEKLAESPSESEPEPPPEQSLESLPEAVPGLESVTKS